MVKMKLIKFTLFSSSKIFYITLSCALLPIICESTEKEIGNENVSNVPKSSDKDYHPESDRVHSRHKRYVYINTQSPVDIGFLIVVPYTFALPSFNLQTSRRLKRSIVRENELLANLTAEDILPSDSYDEPAYAVELAKISTYFAILGVEEDICQQRIICEIFADPENYKPLSSMLSKKLTVDHGPATETYKSRYFRYSRALQEGVSGGETLCKKRYPKCPYSTKDRLHLPALHFWTLLTSMLGIEFKDDYM